VSNLDELANGSWQPILPDAHGRTGEGVTRVLVCSGKIYYELDKEREARGLDDVAILRLEQLYPFDLHRAAHALAGYDKSVPIIWVQEEPENMGAWRFLKLMFGDKIMGHSLRGITRPASASPATGSASSHKKEQERVLNAAFTI